MTGQPSSWLPPARTGSQQPRRHVLQPPAEPPTRQQRLLPPMRPPLPALPARVVVQVDHPFAAAWWATLGVLSAVAVASLTVAILALLLTAAIGGTP